MADNKSKNPSLADALSQGKIGSYQESTGGGTPLPKGEKLKDHPEAHRVSQPRDENGQFTYNSANAKPLKYGPSRGDTIPPFLRGIKLTFAVKSDSVLTADNKTYLAGIDMSAEDLLEAFKEYDEDKGFGALSSTILERKKGRQSAAEKEAIQKGETGTVGAKGEEVKKTKDYAELIKSFTQSFGQYRGKSPENKTIINSVVNKGDDNSNNDNNFSIDDAKNNPEKFMQDHQDEIQEIVDIASKKGFDLDVDAFVADIGAGNITSFKDMKDYLNTI